MKSIDELSAEADELLEQAKQKIANSVDKEYLEKRLYEISKDLEEKYKPSQMRLRAIELTGSYSTDVFDAIMSANHIYNFVMSGFVPKNEEI